MLHATLMLTLPSCWKKLKLDTKVSIFQANSFIPQWHLRTSYNVATIPSFLLLVKGATDHEESDLAAYAAIDMSTLWDIHPTGMDYVLSMEALMYTMPGLQPGYLPKCDAHYLLSRVTILLLYTGIYLNKAVILSLKSILYSS